MRGRIYTVPSGQDAETLAQEIFELTAPATGCIALVGLIIGQATEFGDAAAEILDITIKRAVGAFTSGSGGDAITPVPVRQGDVAASFTAEANNTTAATGGTITDVMTSSWNIRGEYLWLPPEGMEISCHPTDAIIVALSVPADSVTFAATAIVEEIGT
jgi:hypothetical protein